MKRLLILAVFLLLASALPALAQTPAHSVDAIAVWRGEDRNVKYLFRGHTPAIPTHASSTPGPITAWNWFSGDPQAPTLNMPGVIGASGPSAGAPFESVAGPKVAFSREGYALIVYTRIVATGRTACGGFEADTWRGDLRWAIYRDGTAGIVDQGILAPAVPNHFYVYPSVAIDSSGNGLAIWQHVIQNPCTPTADYQVATHFSIWNGLGQPWVQEAHLGNTSHLTGQPDFFVYNLGTAITFNSVVATASATRQQAVAIWWEFIDFQTVVCSGSSTAYPTFWPRYAVWSGRGWNTPDLIPNPPNRWKSFGSPAGTLDISTDQRGNAVPVWPILRVPGVPGDTELCRGDNFLPEVSYARHHGTSTSPGTWPKTAAMYATGSDTSIAFQPAREVVSAPGLQGAISFFTGPAIEGIKRAFYETNDTWAPLSDIGFGGTQPTVAYLPHFRRLAAFVDSGGTIRWHEQDRVTDIRESGPLDRGDHPDLAARGGGTTMPHALNTTIHYATDDQNLAPHTGAVMSRVAAAGSTNLLNFVFNRDRRGATTQSYYMQPQLASLVRDWGVNLDFGALGSLQDVIAWSKEMYPADGYIAVLHDHGLGWQGVCFDDVNRLPLNLNRLKEGLRRGLQDAVDDPVTPEPRRFSHVVFQACLMGMTEVAYQLRGLADYMLASGEVMPARGAIGKAGIPFEQAPVENPFIDPEVLANSTVDAYGAVTAADPIFAGLGLTYASIKLAPIPNLVRDINALGQEIIDFASPGGVLNAANTTIIRNHVSSAIRMTVTGYSMYRDLFDFANSLVGDITNLPTSTRNAAQAVLNHQSSTITNVWRNNDKLNWLGTPGRNWRGLNIWLELNRRVLATTTAAGIMVNSPLSNAYRVTDFGLDAPNWHRMLRTIERTPGLHLSLNSALVPILFTKVTDPQGQSIGGQLRDDLLCRSCQSEIPEASCYTNADDNDTQDIFIPNASGTYLWTVDGTEIAASTTYSLAIQELDDDLNVLQEATSTGTIAPLEIISGQFTIPPPVPDADLPLVTLLSPAEGASLTASSTATTTVSFSYQASDVTSGIRSCSLVIDGTLAQTAINVPEDVPQTFSQFIGTSGPHSWEVSCTDSARERNQGLSETRNFTLDIVDTDLPAITLFSPFNNAAVIVTSTAATTTPVTFTYRTNDPFSAVASCSLMINGVSRKSDATIAENTDQLFTQSLPFGTYSWQIACTDSSGRANQGFSETRALTVRREGGEDPLDQLIKKRRMFFR